MGGGWGEGRGWGGSSTSITFSSPETQRVPNVLTRIVDRDLSRWIALSTFGITGARRKEQFGPQQGFSDSAVLMLFFTPNYQPFCEQRGAFPAIESSENSLDSKSPPKRVQKMLS